MKKILIIAFVVPVLFFSCKKKNENSPVEPNLVFKFVFDSTQQRLDAFGNPSVIPQGHSAQSPVFNKMSAHYIELAPHMFTQIGDGTIIFHNEETDAGGSTAIYFENSYPVGNEEVFYTKPLKSIAAGNYQYLRVSLAYQNYNIRFRVNVAGTDYDLDGTLASFIGYNTYLKSYRIKDSTVVVNGNRRQGYWAFETIYNVSQGLAPEGATTVPNPIASTSPIPAGSCVVTGQFTSPLIITGKETEDIVITVSLSTNKSFEWTEHSTPGIYEPAAGDTVVDMGIRGMRVWKN